MKQEDIIRMAREADPKANLSEPYCLDHETRAWLEAFAELVRVDERKQGQKWFDAVTAQHKQLILAEREACAQVCEKIAEGDPSDPNNEVAEYTIYGIATECATAIRARGNT